MAIRIYKPTTPGRRNASVNLHVEVTKKKPEKSQYIDGRKLSEREIDFEEFLNKRFDSENWLKENGLIF